LHKCFSLLQVQSAIVKSAFFGFIFVSVFLFLRVKRRREISHQNRETTSDLENVVLFLLPFPPVGIMCVNCFYFIYYVVV
jgi:hypothetical protein